MRFRRRKRSNGLWLPQAFEVGGSTVFSVKILGTGPGAFYGAVGEIVQGSGYFNTLTESSLSGGPGGLSLAAQQGWIAKRIVGSIFVGVGNTAGASATATVVCGAAIFHETVSLNNALETGHFDKYNPLNQETAQTRKLWQRVWVLNNPYYTPDEVGILAAGVNFPTTNVEYGSIREGSHVDVKSKATMQLGANLFFGFWATALIVAEGNEGDCDVYFLPNLRTFGRVFQRSGS